MLVLSRKVNETIDISVNGVKVATIMVVEVRGNKARLGLTGGDNVKFMRSELVEGQGGPQGNPPMWPQKAPPARKPRQCPRS